MSLGDVGGRSATGVDRLVCLALVRNRTASAIPRLGLKRLAAVGCSTDTAINRLWLRGCGRSREVAEEGDDGAGGMHDEVHPGEEAGGDDLRLVFPLRKVYVIISTGPDRWRPDAKHGDDEPRHGEAGEDAAFKEGWECALVDILEAVPDYDGCQSEPCEDGEGDDARAIPRLRARAQKANRRTVGAGVIEFVGGDGEDLERELG